MITTSILLSAVAATSHISIESLITDLALILLLGAVTTVFFKWIKQPVVLGYIVAGFLASPHFEYLPSITTEQNIEFWAQIGIVVLLFSLGLEFSFKKLLNAGGSAIVTALIIVMGMMMAGFCIGNLLGWTDINALFLGGMLSMSSTTIIIKAFTDLGITHKKFASQVFAVLIIEDLFAVLMMVILSSIAINNSVQGSELLLSVSKLMFFLIVWFAVGVYVLPSALNRVRRFLNSETLLVVSMGLCLGMAVFSVYCGFSLALGAFIMGSILAGTSFAERIEHVTMPVKDLFGSVFFISVGMMVNPSILIEYSGPILILSAVVIIGMIVFGSVGMLMSGQTLKVAIQSGFALTQIGEFAFIIATLGLQLNVLDPTLYPIVVAVSVLTTFTTPYFIRMAEPVYNFIERHLPARLQFLINRYTESAGHESETTRVWNAVIKRYAWRIMLYAAVLIAISLISQHWLLPWLLTTFPHWGKFLCTLITLSAMAPLLLALSYPASKKAEREILRQANGRFEMPLFVMGVFRLLMALVIMCYAIAGIYSTVIGMLVGIAAFFLIMAIASKRVKRQMRKIENKFINNLNERELRRSGQKNNLISNIHTAYVTVGFASQFLGLKLSESGLRSKYRISVAAIQRHGEIIPVPNGNERIFPGDTLSIIGTEEDIQSVLPHIESQPEIGSRQAIDAHDFKLTSIQLSETSPLVGKTVSESNLSTDYSSLLVSIERDGQHITPDHQTFFQANDTLWLVASPKIIAPLR